MTNADIDFVEVPDDVRKIVGDPDEGTRIYRRYGPEEEVDQWYRTINELSEGEGIVSPGGVSMFAKVSRAGVHKRLKEGRLTAFAFYVVKGYRRISKREILENEGAATRFFIPVHECRSWSKLLEKMPSRQQTSEAWGDGDFSGQVTDVMGRTPRERKRK